MTAGFRSSATEDGGGHSAAAELGVAMRYHRIAKGLSLRGMARRLHLSGHSNLADYERARRLPGLEIVSGYERALQLPAGKLVDLHSRALAERAGRISARPDGHNGAVVHVATAPTGTAGGDRADAGEPAVRVQVSIRVPTMAEPIELAINVACDEGTPPP
ncbi:helix-turn-helix domain-containing protein [Jidongwangia harbinensis]|uniref:helix-turn-helix domain-containing protein n=1 Tax=Jidongwangia harbinensis TaxID=2878561 RepID=UPI001CD957E7|nr:helix-turn-helix transcriptional regulator [Jidongwangia harbinensis]MCA2211676.1 helix-turn-helix transcriptional regulator [Jidongwangia harbinensis]